MYNENEFRQKLKRRKLQRKIERYARRLIGGALLFSALVFGAETATHNNAIASVGTPVVSAMEEIPSVELHINRITAPKPEIILQRLENKSVLSQTDTDIETAPSLLPTEIPVEEEEEVAQFDRTEKIYDIPLDSDIQWYIYDICLNYGVKIDIALGTVYVESKFNPDCTNKNRNGSVDKGLFQINECNYEALEKKYDGFDPMNIYQNIEAGIYLISEAMKHDATPTCYMMVYNMGAGGAKKNWNVGRYSTEYSRKVANYAKDVLPGLVLQSTVLGSGVTHY